MINFLDFLGLESINLESIIPILNSFWAILKAWWWVFVPFILFPYLKFFYLWYIESKWDATVKRIILEVKIPQEVSRLVNSMEHVFAGFHGMHDVFTWRQKWIEGQFQLSLSFEIVSIGGEIHFYIRIPEDYRDLIETNIYSQFPEAEISQVEDYTKNVPQNIPNKEWNLFAWDMIASNKSPYPLRTYKDFGEAPSTPEEKRITPLAGLLEGMAVLKPGEQMWVQITTSPVREEIPWAEDGRKIVAGIVKRPLPAKPKSIIGEAADVLITGKPPGVEEKPKEEIIPPEMKLTPGERDIVKAIEDKISKVGYYSNIRCIYLGKRDVFFKPKARIIFGFFKEVSTENVNGLKPWGKTFPRVEWIFPKIRTYLRLRRLFRKYVMRLPPLFPGGPAYPHENGRYILNIEELATLFHFPGRMAAPAPGISRIGAKKGEPPAIPTE